MCFDDDADELSFVDLFRAHTTGIFVCEVVVACGGTGEGRGTHYIVADCWRRLLFLGAGELQREWLVGLIGVRGDDLRGDALDRRLAAELRVLQLLNVRVLKTHLATATGVKRQGRPNGRQRAKIAKKWAAQEKANAIN